MRIMINIIIGIIIIALIILMGLMYIGARSIAGKDSKLTNATAKILAKFRGSFIKKDAAPAAA